MNSPPHLHPHQKKDKVAGMRFGFSLQTSVIYCNHKLNTVYKNTERESEVAQSCLTLCDTMDCSLSGFSIHGIFQARVPEWVAISFSSGSSWPRDQTQISCTAGRWFTLSATREAPSQRQNTGKSHTTSPENKGFKASSELRAPGYVRIPGLGGEEEEPVRRSLNHTWRCQGEELCTTVQT